MDSCRDTHVRNKTQQFNPQVNTKVDEIVIVVTENLFSGLRILDIISLFHYHLHQIDGFFHHSTVKRSLSCNTQFPYYLSHHIKCARNTSTTRNPQHSHRYFVSGKLRDNRKLQDFQRFPWQWVINIHGTRGMKHKISFKSQEIVSSRLISFSY